MDAIVLRCGTGANGAVLPFAERSRVFRRRSAGAALGCSPHCR